MSKIKDVDEQLASKLKKVAQAKHAEEINDAFDFIISECETFASCGHSSHEFSFEEVFDRNSPEEIITLSIHEKLKQFGFAVNYTQITGTFNAAINVSWLEA